MNKITMLGTGNALVSHIYNTCFVLETDKTQLLVDAGGGNEKPISLSRIFTTYSLRTHIPTIYWAWFG